MLQQPRIVSMPLPFVELVTDDGIPVLIPEVLYNERLRGKTAFSLRVTIDDTPPKTNGWLNVTQAAELHLSDRDGMTLEVARVRVSRAASGAKFACLGTGRGRRIDPTSFAAWRLSERERALAEADE